MKKKSTIIIAVLLVLGIANLQADPPDPPAGYYWELVVEDHFDGTELDLTKWNYNYRWGATDSDGGEVRYDNYLLPSHVEVKGGLLRLKTSENLFPADLPKVGNSKNNSEYRLMNKGSSKYMYPEGGSRVNNTRIRQRLYGDDDGTDTYFDTWSDSEWKLVPTGSFNYKLMNMGANKFLTRNASGQIVIRDNTNDDTQVWTLTALDGGWYNLKNVSSNTYLSQDGMYITEASTGTGNNQQFKIFCKLQWICGVVTNYQQISMKRGSYVEASMRMPASTGCWPAFWLMRDGWPPEVDILEYLSTEPKIVHNIHFKNSTNENKSSMKEYKGNATEWNSNFKTLGFYMASTGIDPDAIFTWYVDNNWAHGWWSSEYYTQFYDMYTIFSAGNGGWAGYPDADSNFPNYFDIEWYKYWELRSYSGCLPTDLTPHLQVGDGDWQSTKTIKVAEGSTLKFGPQAAEEGGSWSWSGLGTSGSSREQTIVVTESGTAVATYTNTDGCTSSITFTVTLTGDCTPTDITPYLQVNDGEWQNVSSVTVNSGDKINIGPHPWEGGSWSWSGLASGINREVTIYPTASGVATTTYTNADGCNSTLDFTITVDTPTNMHEFRRLGANISPNPVRDVLRVDINEQNITNVTIDILNAMGQTVQSRNSLQKSTQYFNASNLQKGVYFVRISNKETRVTHKFIKQ